MLSNKDPKIQKHKTGFSTLKMFILLCLCKLFLGNVKGCHKIEDCLSFVLRSWTVRKNEMQIIKKISIFMLDKQFWA